MTEKFYLSQDRFESLEKELEELKTEGRNDIAQKLKNAKELGDLSENFEYQEARKEKDLLEQKINRVENIIRNSEIIKKPVKKDVVFVGSKVTVNKNGKESSYTIVGSSETDPENGLISNESPLGKNLINSRVGDEVKIKTPKGDVSYKVVKID
ncbi:MAG: transcription elongation factor GreA [Candidatus Paceibacterota bacterium]